MRFTEITGEVSVWRNDADGLVLHQACPRRDGDGAGFLILVAGFEDGEALGGGTQRYIEFLRPQLRH